MEKKRDIAVDALKGVAILTVILEHVYREESLTHLVIGEIGRWAVPAFFMIQGFYLNRTILTSWLGNAEKKIKRIYFPFLIWSLLYGVYFWLVDQKPFTVVDVVLGETAVHLYFIIYYMLFALFLPLLYRLPQKARHWCCWVMIISNFMVCLALELQHTYGITFTHYTGINPVKWWGFVAIGMLFGERRKTLNWVKQHWLAAIIVSTGLAVLGAVFPFMTDTVGYMYYRWSLFPLAIGCTFMITAFFSKWEAGRVVFAYIGRRSFSIYLSHFLVVHIFKYIVGIKSLWLVAILTIAICLCPITHKHLHWLGTKDSPT